MHGRNRLRENLQIERQGPVVDVLHVRTDPLVELRLATVDLPEASDARLHAEAPPVPACIDAIDVAHRQRARADEAHVAHEHVRELRQLVEAQAAEQATEAGAARVFLDLEDRTLGFVQVLELGLQLFGVDDHRPELVGGEAPPIEADALLDEEDRPLGVELHGDRDRRQDRREEEEAGAGAGDVDHALRQEAQRVRWAARDRDDGLLAERIDRGLAPVEGGQMRDDAHGDALLSQSVMMGRMSGSDPSSGSPRNTSSIGRVSSSAASCASGSSCRAPSPLPTCRCRWTFRCRSREREGRSTARSGPRSRGSRGRRVGRVARRRRARARRR
mgnify:CR=1 FL=1